MLPHTKHSMLTPKPHPLHINIVRQIPDLLGGVDGVGVVAMHDARVVEHDVHASPRVDVGDHGFDIGFLGDVGLVGFEAGRVVDYGADFFEGGVEGWGGDVGHEDCGAFAGEEDGGFEADAAGWEWISVVKK